MDGKHHLKVEYCILNFVEENSLSFAVPECREEKRKKKKQQQMAFWSRLARR